VPATEAADVAAGEEQRVHHKGIGGEGQAVGVEEQGGAVIAAEILAAVTG